MLRDAEVTIRDLREKLAVAHQTIHGMQTEVAAERQVRQKENDAVMMGREGAPPTVRESGSQVVRRPVGRPRKATVVGEMAQTSTMPSEKPLAIRAQVSTNRDE